MDGPCLNSQIDLCYAPCADNISEKEYSEIINKIDLFFQGKYSVIVKNLKKEMKYKLNVIFLLNMERIID